MASSFKARAVLIAATDAFVAAPTAPQVSTFVAFAQQYAAARGEEVTRTTVNRMMVALDEEMTRRMLKADALVLYALGFEMARQLGLAEEAP